MNRPIRLLLALGLAALLLPTSALADGWADEEFEDDDEGGMSKKEILEHVTRADALAKAPSIPLMITGLVVGGPGSLLASGGNNTGAINVSNGGGFMLGMSLGTSISGGMIANMFGGNPTTWGLFVAGASTSTVGVIMYQASFQTYYTGGILGSSPDFGAIAPGVVAGMSMVIVGEILTMISSGTIQDEYEEMALVAPRRRPPTIAAAPMPLGKGMGVAVAGTF
mgnify:CR=1 FL=1